MPDWKKDGRPRPELHDGSGTPYDVSYDGPYDMDQDQQLINRFRDRMYHTKDILEQPIFVETGLGCRVSAGGINDKYWVHDLHRIFEEISNLVESMEYSDLLENEEYYNKAMLCFELISSWNDWVWSEARSCSTSHINPYNYTKEEALSKLVKEAQETFPRPTE